MLGLIHQFRPAGLRRRGRSVAVGLLVAFVLTAGLVPEATAQVASGRRVALVVGNAAYKEGPLRNPVNDARAMAEVLKERGFEVILRENASKLDLERVVADFGEKLQQGATGLFYYAGHGMQVNGRNYLIPVDAQIPSEQRVRLESVDVDLVLEQMQAARSTVNLVILDACRNNPFERRFRSTGGGLAQINAPEGTLIAYATSPGSVAADGTSKHSLYTEELLKAMQAPGAKVEEVFKTVRVAVSRRSNGAQTPWEASSLTGDFFFVPPAPVTAVSPPPEPVQTGPNRAAIELAYWESVKGSSNPAELQAYLAQYPDGAFAGLARARIATLTTPAPAPAPAPVQVQTGPSRAELDATFWDSVKGSSNPAELQAYLAQHPEGAFAGLARARIATLTAPRSVPAPAPAPPPVQAGPSRAELDTRFWNSVKDSTNTAELQAYLAEFPDGTFAALATARIAALAAPRQQLAALPPGTEPPTASSFNGTYTAVVRHALVGPDDATITVVDLKITGRMGKDCSVLGEIDEKGGIKRMEAICTGDRRPHGPIAFRGAFKRDSRTGSIAGDTRLVSPASRYDGVTVKWQ